MARSGYRTPKKGTKIRAAMLLMLRPQGATAEELGKNITRALNSQAEDFGGWDVRSFKLPGTGRIGRRPVAYRIVGKSLWSGRYRDLTARSRS